MKSSFSKICQIEFLKNKKEKEMTVKSELFFYVNIHYLISFRLKKEKNALKTVEYQRNFEKR